MIAGVNAEEAIAALHANKWLINLAHDGPDWGRTVLSFVLSKWVLAAASFYLGMLGKNGLDNYLDRTAGRSGAVPLWWLRRRTRIARSLIDRSTLTAIVDLARELEIIERHLTSPAVDLPPLPTRDPRDTGGMALTDSYLRTILPFLTTRGLPHARVIGSAVLVHHVVTEPDQKVRNAVLALSKVGGMYCGIDGFGTHDGKPERRTSRHPTIDRLDVCSSWSHRPAPLRVGVRSPNGTTCQTS